MKELQSLALDVKVLDKDNNEIDLKQTFDEDDNMGLCASDGYDDKPMWPWIPSLRTDYAMENPDDETSDSELTMPTLTSHDEDEDDDEDLS